MDQFIVQHLRMEIVEAFHLWQITQVDCERGKGNFIDFKVKPCGREIHVSPDKRAISEMHFYFEYARMHVNYVFSFVIVRLKDFISNVI